MSVLTPLHVTRRRKAGPPAGGAVVTSPEWHVGLSHTGMFPQHEVGCPCTKAPCGLAIPRAEIFCSTHQSRAEFLQAHSSADCAPHKWFRRHRS